MIKLLIGGSPCTHWSIAQKNNRETQPEGVGWELFRNYLIAKEKFSPDFFLYENNKSASSAIKEQIRRELGVNDILTGGAEQVTSKSIPRSSLRRTAKGSTFTTAETSNSRKTEGLCYGTFSNTELPTRKKRIA